MHAAQGIRKILKYSRYTQKIRLRNQSSAPTTELIEVKAEPEPEYPPIEDLSEIAEELRRKDSYYEKIKKLNTVEEKLYAINVQRYYGWPAFHLHENKIPYDYLKLVQFVTRTELQECERLPVYTDNAYTRQLLSNVKSELERVLVFETQAKKYKHEVKLVLQEEDELPELEKKFIKTRNIVYQINSAISRVVAPEYSHIFDAQVDYEPRIESFWRVGGFYPTKEDKKLRKFKEFTETRIDERIDRYFAYFGTPVLQLRSKIPLLEVEFPQQAPKDEEVKVKEVAAVGDKLTVVETAAAEVKPQYHKYDIEEYRYDPKTYYQIERERIHAAIIPGFWPNDSYRFGILSYHDTNHLSERPSEYGEEDFKEALHSQAILASHAWLLGQACYQGFSPYYEITYPFATQTILTDGKVFSFYQYQLNTTVLHTNATNPDNPLRNQCSATLSKELYHDIQDDSVIGWNDDVLLHLISMYINTPKERVGVNLSPYLHPTEKLVANIEDDQRRQFLHNGYLWANSHRPRYQLAPEIYDWERIYKIDHQKRPMDARKRFFEKFEDPINDRKLSDHGPPYIPKMFRPEDKKKRHKFKPVFYPDVYQDYKDVV